MNIMEIPRIIIEKNKFIIDHKEPIKGNYFKCVIFIEQKIRALRNNSIGRIICASIDDKPVVKRPISFQCNGCSETIIGSEKCILKYRLWLVMKYKNEVRPFIMVLNPLESREWHKYKIKLSNNRLSMDTISTVFSYENEVLVHMEDFATAEMKVMVKKVYQECEKKLMIVDERDFSE